MTPTFGIPSGAPPGFQGTAVLGGIGGPRQPQGPPPQGLLPDGSMPGQSPQWGQQPRPSQGGQWNQTTGDEDDEQWEAAPSKGAKRPPWEKDREDWEDWKTSKAHKKEKKEGKEPKDKKEKKDDKKDKKEMKQREKAFRNAPEKLHGEDWEAPREEVGLKLVKEYAPTVKWAYPFWNDSRRSYAGYLKSPFSKQDRERYFVEIRDGTNWLQPTTDKGNKMPRKTAWLVAKGCQCTYSYGPFEVPPIEYPPWMLKLMKYVMPLCGLDNEEDWPNSCNANLYEDGAASVGWHADDESLFQGKFQDILIISLSFGVKRKFELRYNCPDEGKDILHTIPIGDGELMTMEGMCQKHMQHRVPKEDNIWGPRINLTWRWVAKHRPACPVGRCRR